MDEYGQRPDLPAPRYSMLNGGDAANGARQRPPRPPKGHNSSRRGACCGCLLGFFCLLFLVAVVVAAAIGFAVTYYKPKVPSFYVDGIYVRVLDVNASALTLHAKIAANVSIENPNKRVSAFFQRGSRISVVYRQTTLCQGELPSFYLGTGNRTTVEATMDGRRGFNARLQKELKEDEAAGRVPVAVYIHMPVVPRLSGLDLFEVTVEVSLSTVVGSLSPDSVIDVNNKDTRYDSNYML